VRRMGNEGVVAEYPAICREILDGLLAGVGFGITKWAIHSSGHGGQMTHYGAVIERKKAPAENHRG
jgi:hypothetical protein